MGKIFIDGVGEVTIKGNTPNEEEEKAIMMGLADTDGEGQDTIIPELINPDLAQDRLPQGLEKIGGRPTFEAAGAIGGSVVGGATATPASMVIGGTLGGAGGGQLYDVIQSFITGDSLTTGGQFKALKKDASREALLQTFFAKIPGMGRYIKSKLVSKDPSTKKIYNSGKEIGFPTSISDVGSGFAKGYGKVIGVFPFVGNPFKASVVSKANMLNKTADDILNTFAPNVSLTNLGMDMTAAAKATFGDFKRVTGFLYDDFYNTANKLKAPVISTNNFKKTLNNYVDAIDDGLITLSKGKTLKSPNKDTIYKYAKSALEIPEYINVSQYKSLMKDIQKFAKLSSKEGTDQGSIFGMKGALEKDLNMLANKDYLKSFNKVVDIKTMELIRNKLLFANKVYSTGLENSIVNKVVKDKTMQEFAKKQGINLKEYIKSIPSKKLFESPAAKRFQGVDRNIFGPGFERQGGIYADQLGSVLVNSKNVTPQLMDDLYSLVGKKQYNKFVRQRMQKAYEGSLVDNGVNGMTFDPSKFEDALGLTTESGRAIIKKMLKDTPLKIEKLDAFFDVAKNHGSLKVPDVSSFIQRRATLGGTKSVFGGMMMGYSTFANPIRGLSLIYMARSGSKMLVDPKNLDLVMDAMNYNAPAPRVYNATLQILNNLIKDETNTTQATNEFKLVKEIILENKDALLKEFKKDKEDD